MLDDLIWLVPFVALVAAAVWFNARLSRMEREHRALLSFVLSAPQIGPQMTASVVPAGIAPIADEPSDPPAPDESSLLDTHPAPADGPALSVASPAPAAAAESPVETAQPAPPSSSRPGGDVETALGTRWAVWVGGIALALGGVFLVRYSIEAGFFGPAARLVMAGLFGLALLAGGEFIRRTGFKVPIEGAVGAYIPAILTAAGAFTLFGAIYAAHGVYGFIGPATAFVLLGIAGLATVALGLVHGQALGGLGLLGSLVTPIMVASEAPSPWTLFGYLAVVLVAAVAVARLRRWSFLATAAFAGVGIWILLYLGTADRGTIDLTVISFIALVSLATLALLWLGDFVGEVHPAEAATDWPSAAVAISLTFAVLVLGNEAAFELETGLVHGAILVVGMIAAAFWRHRALPLVIGAGLAVALTYLRPALSGSFSFDIAGATMTVDGLPSAPLPDRLRLLGGLFVALFLASGVWKAHVFATGRKSASFVWAAWAAAVAVLVPTCLWMLFGNPDRDYAYAAATVLVSALLVLGAEWVARAEEPPFTGGLSVSALAVGAGIAAVAFLHMAFGPGLTTMLAGASAVLPALATRYRSYPVLGWLCVGAVAVVLIRVALDPSVVGETALGRTPVFNALLPGYGIPALAFAFAAWQLARTTNGRPRLAMEAAAVLFALLAVAMLVRHAMNGGVIYSLEYTLAEQAIYTLIGFGAGAMLIAIGRHSPSVVMNQGSIVLGVMAVIMAVLQHFLLLNPLFTDESTGGIPVFNLLFLAYLLPALAAGGLALYARGKRPYWYSAMLGLLAALLAFAYETLSVRRWFQGEYIGLWRGMTQLETYAYSAGWLLLGVALLVIGVVLKSYILRLASAALIAVAVAKVFLFDMSELEGVLRALSFIGLGAVLIGIGLFYQRLLVRQKATEPAPAIPPA